MSTALDSFFPWVLPMVPGCSDPMARQAIRSAALDFCTRTDLIQTITTANSVAGTQDYTLSAPADTQVQRVLGVGFQGTWLCPVSPETVYSDTALRGANVGTALVMTGQPLYFFQKTPTATPVSLYPIPDANNAVTLGLTFKFSTVPTTAAATLDDVLFTDWVDDIAAGAVAILMSMPGQPFTSQYATRYLTQFNSAINEAKRQKSAGQMVQPLRVTPRRFA